jgi:hypothetical protein
MVRLPRVKEHDVKISMFMVVAGAAIVFAAPLANASTDKSHHSLPAHKIAKHGKTAKGKSSSKLGKSAGMTSKPVTPRPPLYIYVPSVAGTPATADSTDQCETFGVDCTDAQLCELWGENCSTAGTSSTDQTDGQPADQSDPSQPPAMVNTSDGLSDTSAATVDASNAQETAPAYSWCEAAFEGC